MKWKEFGLAVTRMHDHVFAEHVVVAMLADVSWLKNCWRKINSVDYHLFVGPTRFTRLSDGRIMIMNLCLNIVSELTRVCHALTKRREASERNRDAQTVTLYI